MLHRLRVWHTQRRLKVLLDEFPEEPGPKIDVSEFRELGELGVECLLDVVATGEYVVAGKAARVLGRLRATSAATALKKLFPKVSPYTQGCIVRAYGDMRDPTLIPELGKLAASGNHQQAAVEALARSRQPEAVPLLIKVLEDDRSDEWTSCRKKAAATGLLRFAGSAVIDALTDLLRCSMDLPSQKTKIRTISPDNDFNRAAIAHLSQMDAPKAHRALFALIADTRRAGFWEWVAEAIEGAGIEPATPNEAALLALAKGQVVKAARGGAPLVRKIVAERYPQPTVEQWAKLIALWKSTPGVADEFLKLLGERSKHDRYVGDWERTRGLVTALIELGDARVAGTIIEWLTADARFDLSQKELIGRENDARSVVGLVNRVLPLLCHAVSKLGDRVPVDALRHVLAMTPLEASVTRHESDWAGDAHHAVGRDHLTTAPELDRVQQAARTALAMRA